MHLAYWKLHEKLAAVQALLACYQFFALDCLKSHTPQHATAQHTMRALLALATTAAALTAPQKNVEVTLKLAMDRNGAVDDLGDKAERFTSPASLVGGGAVLELFDGLASRENDNVSWDQFVHGVEIDICCM